MRRGNNGRKSHASTYGIGKPTCFENTNLRVSTEMSVSVAEWTASLVVSDVFRIFRIPGTQIAMMALKAVLALLGFVPVSKCGTTLTVRRSFIPSIFLFILSIVHVNAEATRIGQN